MRTHSVKTICRFVIGIPLLLPIGCGSDDQPELGKVSGLVTLDGKPLPHVEITFAPDVGRPSYGETADDGKYELNYVRDIQGAKVGRHTVTIRSTKVDNSKIKPAEVKPGKNRIDIECTPRSQQHVQPDDAQPAGDDT